MVSAACPECSIVLVEADSPNSWDLGPAVSEAVVLGAVAVSNSYGANEDPNDQFGLAYSDGPYTSYFEHPGVIIAVASGDDLYNNQTLQPTPGIPATLAPSFPSTVPSVLSVGGTSLTSGTGTTRGGYTEAIWNQGNGGTTSGCSAEFAKPSFQSASPPVAARCARTSTWPRSRRTCLPTSEAHGLPRAARAARFRS
jgi:hypothetical protein